MTISVKQGNLHVLQTGAVLVTNNEPTTIIIDGNYSIKILYVDDPENKEQKISTQQNEKGISIELKNFSNPLGTSTTTPLPVAQQGDLTISISLMVTAVGAVKILYYGIYLGA